MLRTLSLASPALQAVRSFPVSFDERPILPGVASTDIHLLQIQDRHDLGNDNILRTDFRTVPAAGTGDRAE